MELWANPPSIGCDEYYRRASGALQVNLRVDFTNVATGFKVNLSCNILGHAASNRWTFGDGAVEANQVYVPFVFHVWTNAGDYVVNLSAYNETYPAGVAASVTIHVVPQPVHYVSLGSVSSAAPYVSWATAATNIQDAVDAATVSGAIVLVTNGTYSSGGKSDGYTFDRVLVSGPLILRSVNGPQFTVIDGGQANRCIYLGQGASISGFTFSGGKANGPGNSPGEYGGGVFCVGWNETVSNCVISENWAYAGGGSRNGTILDCTYLGNIAGQGGGAFGGKLVNCALYGNSASFGGGGCYLATVLNSVIASNRASGLSLDGVSGGGGAFQSWLCNCTVVGNSAKFGGGVVRGELTNCIVYLNTAEDGANYFDDPPDYSLGLDHCCTVPIPPNGDGNINQAPLFVDFAHGNLRLQPNSPCINAGNNIYAPVGQDLDGNPRIVGGTVDSADYADSDDDGMNNWQEWIAGTDPTNAASALRMLAPSGVTNGPGVNVSWQSVSGISYFIERSTNLTNQPAFSLLQTNIPGQPGTTTYTDTSAVGAGPFFYRVGVSN